MVGTVCRFIGGVDKDSGRFMCVKVNLDISLPLCRGRVVSLEKGAKTWASLLLTMSGSLIYATGVDDLIAVTRIAPLCIQSKGSLPAEQRKFGQFLRASPYISFNKPIIFVPGFYDNVVSTSKASEDRRRGGC